MVLIQTDLTEEENYILKAYMVKNGISNKAQAIKNLINSVKIKGW